jgi:RNA polymerase sigma factor (sigma-70 family)
MGSDLSTTIATDVLLDSFVRGERGGKIRTQLGGRFPECSAEQIEDAVQYACKAFLDEAEDVSAPGAVYAWIRTAAFRYLNREAVHHRRELAVDPVKNGLATVAADEPGPAEELISHEDDADLAMLVEEVSSSLSDRRRGVLALYGAGYRRPQIADRLGLTERTVKRDLREIMDLARQTIARLAGGGCDRGEPLVMRFVCGISTPDESAQAREHLSHCGRCELFSERLIAWREKAGAMLPAPVAEGVSPGVLERLAQKSADGFSSLKQHVLDGGAQIKQHATTTYYRAVDPTPLAAARPGTVASVIASCIAIGGGATYCVEQGVDPLGAAKRLIASAPESGPKPTAPPESESQGPTYTPAGPRGEEAPAPEPTPEPAASEPQPQPEPESPPPEFEPVAEPEANYEAPAPEPAPVPPSSGPQFGGP